MYQATQHNLCSDVRPAPAGHCLADAPPTWRLLKPLGDVPARPDLAWLFQTQKQQDPELVLSSEQRALIAPVPEWEVPGFRLLAELGQGSFSQVFLARQVDLGNRLVVLKLAADVARKRAFWPS